MLLPSRVHSENACMFAEQAQKMVETMAEAFEVTFKRTEEMREQRQVWEVHFT